MPSSLARIRIGTRGSQLALYQATTVARLLRERGGPDSEIVVIKTSGDRLQERPLSEVGGKRLFVKEIEDALLAGEVDLAVHSSKDMPALLPDGLCVAGALPREDPRDALVLPSHGVLPAPTVEAVIATLGRSPSIGTSSVRRVAQLTRLLPDARFSPVRGNLDTRLRKLDEGVHDAIVLAAAGLRRLGLVDRISFALPTDACLPSPGQGIIAIETRTADETLRRTLVAITDPHAAQALRAERAVVDGLGGGCQTPIGALATHHPHGHLVLDATVIAVDGSRALHGHAEGRADEAEALGQRVAELLLAQGAAELLAQAAQQAQTPRD